MCLDPHSLITDHNPLQVIYNDSRSRPPARIESWFLRRRINNTRCFHYDKLRITVVVDAIAGRYSLVLENVLKLHARTLTMSVISVHFSNSDDNHEL